MRSPREEPSKHPTARWREAGLTVDINLHPIAPSQRATLYIWDERTGNMLYVAHHHGATLDQCVEAVAPAVNSHLSRHPKT